MITALETSEKREDTDHLKNKHLTATIEAVI
jgi:hypothetical protein